jgi:acyl-coenzyme A synthetase/AMP-(fatty) acid ligase
MITPLPGAWLERPGSASMPFFGVVPVLLDPESGVELEGEAEGVLCIKQVPMLHSRAFQSIITCCIQCWVACRPLGLDCSGIV